MNQSDSPSEGGRKRILLVDDSPIVLATMSDLLTGAGYSVKTVLYPTESQGSLALVVARSKPDLVLNDVDMPVLKGDQLTKIIKRNVLTKEVKVYFFSSEAPEKLKEMVTQSGADGFIQKTKDPAELLAKIRAIMPP